MAEPVLALSPTHLPPTSLEGFIKEPVALPEDSDTSPQQLETLSEDKLDPTEVRRQATALSDKPHRVDGGLAAFASAPSFREKKTVVN